MQDFPSYNVMNSCDYIRRKEETISFFEKKNEEFAVSGFNAALDPSETMFRKMLNKVEHVNRQIKQLSSPQLKQATFFNSVPTKEKQSSTYPSKKLKRN